MLKFGNEATWLHMFQTFFKSSVFINLAYGSLSAMEAKFDCWKKHQFKIFNVIYSKA